MGTEIGTVNISLRMSLAQFKQDTTQGTQAATKATQDMARNVGRSSEQARASLALIGEEVGVRIPRHLRTFITELPGLGTALNAAFDSVAVIALLGLIVELGQKISSLAAESSQAAADWKTFNDGLDDLTHKADPLAAKLSEVGTKLTELNTKQADSSTIWKAVSEATGEAADAFLFVNPHLSAVIDLFHKGDPAAQAFAKSIGDFYENLKTIERDEGPAAALAAVTAKLNELYASSDRANPAIYETIKSLESVQVALGRGVDDKFNAAVQKAAEDAKKAIDAEWEAYQRMQTIIKQSAITKPNATSQTVEDLKRTGIYTDTAPALGGQPGGPPVFPQQKIPLPVYTGTNAELVKIQTDENEALKEAGKIYEQTRTSQENYQNEVAVLNQLLKDGKIDQDTYNRAITEAKAKYDTTAKALGEMGQNIGDTLKQAALFGRSWSDAFKSIAIEITQAILKLTLFKNLSSGGSSSGGGFFSSLLGGLFGGFKAAGGPLDSGKWYIAGEHGPEPVWGGGAGAFAMGYPKAAAAGGGSVTNIEMHVHGVTDADSFRKSRSQIGSQMASELSRHQRRNG